MGSSKSLDELELISSLLYDFSKSHGTVFDTKALRLTLQKVRRRYLNEGLSFLTVALPRLGKAFDKALSGSAPLNSAPLGFAPQKGSNLPLFMGEFFSRVLANDGALLQSPCASCVRVLRQVLYCFYKYKLPYTDEQELKVIRQFETTETELSAVSSYLDSIREKLDACNPHARRVRESEPDEMRIARDARHLLSDLFSHFDPTDITPRHGPGAVATREQLWEKYRWTNISKRITDVYPFDAYFCASLGHVCDSLTWFSQVTDKEDSARVLLVPKDSRGPRLISCEPLAFQWVQQGLRQRIVDLVEAHPLTKWNVSFTDQQPNMFGALLGSKSGYYSTLDLNEASDRVSLSLVRLLFPVHILTYLEASRSLSTQLPDGRELTLGKFAPMGSALCFPVLALTIWAILTAAATDADTRESIRVYGDDVIVPTAFAEEAMKQLESFGLKINRDKSCTGGLFRESCGMDAFNGVNVTPVRIRTVWESSRSPDVYESWIAYANSFFSRRCYATYNLIVERLRHFYGPIPSKEQVSETAPSLADTVGCGGPIRSRWNPHLQRREYHVWTVKTPIVRHEIDGWSMLLRYFTEGSSHQSTSPSETRNGQGASALAPHPAFSVSSYTRRKTSLLVKRWR